MEDVETYVVRYPQRVQWYAGTGFVELSWLDPLNWTLIEPPPNAPDTPDALTR